MHGYDPRDPDPLGSNGLRYGPKGPDPFGSNLTIKQTIQQVELVSRCIGRPCQVLDSQAVKWSVNFSGE